MTSDGGVDDQSADQKPLAPLVAGLMDDGAALRASLESIADDLAKIELTIGELGTGPHVPGLLELRYAIAGFKQRYPERWPLAQRPLL